MGASDIPPGPKRSFPKTVYVVVEAAKGSRNVYRYDEDLGVLVLERVLSSTYACPADYGFVPQTLCEDGEKLRCFLLTLEPVVPGALVPSKPAGVLNVRGEKFKKRLLLAVPSEEVDPRFARVESLVDVPSHFLAEIKAFASQIDARRFVKWAKIDAVDGCEDAKKLVLEAHRQYQRSVDALD